MFSDELTVPRYRTEKPSKSPPPPPPRRSFPSSPGVTTRSGEPLIPGKSIKVTEKNSAFNNSSVLILKSTSHHIKIPLLIYLRQNCKLLTPALDKFLPLFVLVALEGWIWRDRGTETSHKTEEDRVRKPSSVINTSHTGFWRQRGGRGGENCCRIGGKENTRLIISPIVRCSLEKPKGMFLVFMLRPQFGASLCVHTGRQCLFRYAHPHYHMFKQQVPYVPSPWHCESPKITYCSLTHIITQGSQITARQMDPDSCLDCVRDDLLKLNRVKTQQ